MSKGVQELSTELLTRRKKFATFILGILLGVTVIVIITAVSTGEYNMLFAIAGLASVSIPMTSGLRKINEELNRRSNGDT